MKTKMSYSLKIMSYVYVKDYKIFLENSNKIARIFQRRNNQSISFSFYNIMSLKNAIQNNLLA